MSSTSAYRSILADGILFAFSAVLIWGLLTLTFEQSVRLAEQESEPIGEIEHRTSEVRRRADGTLVWQELNRGGPVYERDAVYAGPDSEAVIAFDDGSRIEVDQNSLVVVQRASDTKTALPSISIDVRRGGASGKVGSGKLAIQAGGTRLVVERGGAAKVRLTKDRSAKINVTKGRALVETKAGSVAVEEGQRSIVDAGSGHATPVQQLSISLVAPKPAARRFLADPKEDVVFKWKPHEGVNPYVFDLSRDADFTNIIASIKTESPSVIQSQLEPGIYYWRVSRKLESGDAYSEERKLALVLDAPPILVQPRHDQLVDLSNDKTVLFSWSEVPDVARYRIELARETNFDKPVVQSTVDRPTFRLDRQWEEGQYCFRVRSEDEQRPSAPWSELNCFRVITKPLFRAPKGFKAKREKVSANTEPPKESWLWRLFGSVAYADDAKSSALTIRWEKIPGAPGYLIEIAEDKAFKKVVIKKKVSHNYYRWRTVVRRTHYWRVRVVDDEGREGEVSASHRIDPEVSRPVLKGPSPNKRYAFQASAPRITLQWKGSEVLNQFFVEIATDASFSETVVSEKVKGTTKYVLKDAAIGEFFWRVTGIDLLGASTKPSDSRRFTVFVAPPKLLGPPDEQVFVWEEDVLSIPLRWAKRPVKSYEIQVAEDAQFSKVVDKLTSARASLQLNPKTMGPLYWRVRGASPKTPWSAPSGVTVSPAIPVPMIPEDGSSKDFEGEQATVELRWNEVPHVTLYDVEVVREGQNATEPPETHRVEAASASLVLPQGRFSWTVRAVHASGTSSERSTSQSFELAKKEVEAVRPQPVVVKAKPKPVIEAVVEPSEPAAWHLAPLFGFQYNFGAIFAPRFGVEIAYLLPILDRHVRVGLSVNYLTSNTTQASEQGDQSFESRLHGFPIELVGAYIFNTSIVDLSVGGGLSLNLRYRKVEIPTQPTVEQTDVEVGGVIVAGAARSLGVGSLLAQVSYVLATRSNSGVVENAPGGLGFTLGYRIGIW